jgi:hypothetical protein
MSLVIARSLENEQNECCWNDHAQRHDRHDRLIRSQGFLASHSTVATYVRYYVPVGLKGLNGFTCMGFCWLHLIVTPSEAPRSKPREEWTQNLYLCVLHRIGGLGIGEGRQTLNGMAWHAELLADQRPINCTTPDLGPPSPPPQEHLGTLCCMHSTPIQAGGSRSTASPTFFKIQV